MPFTISTFIAVPRLRILARGFARPLSTGPNQPNNTVMVQVPVLLLNELIDAQRRRDVERREWEVERRMFYLVDKGQAVRMAEMTKDALRMLEDKVRFEEGFNIRGGLERICYQAVLERHILHSGGIQDRLDAIAKIPAFAEIYDEEITRRRLTKTDVDRCRKRIYHELSKHAHGNQGVIMIRSNRFTPNELGAVVSYYKMQDTWNNPLTWEELVEKDTYLAGLSSDI